MEHGAGAPAHADIPRLQHLERDERGVDQVPQFMGEEPEPLGSARGSPSSGTACVSRPYSVTAPAIASSRHRFSVRKSSVLIGASVSSASSVMD